MSLYSNLYIPLMMARDLKNVAEEMSLSEMGC